MFTIRCESCAARLKVKQASLINQVLACPRCGSMIQVTPPADWVPEDPGTSSTTPPLPAKSASPAPSPPVVSTPTLGKAPQPLDSADFSDIEKLIAEQGQRKATGAGPLKTPRQPVAAKGAAHQDPGQSTPAAGVTSSKRAGAPNTASPTSAARGTAKGEAPARTSGNVSNAVEPLRPLSPTQAVSPATLRRRKILLGIGGGVVSLLLILGLIYGFQNYLRSRGAGNVGELARGNQVTPTDSTQKTTPEQNTLTSPPEKGVEDDATSDGSGSPSTADLGGNSLDATAAAQPVQSEDSDRSATDNPDWNLAGQDPPPQVAVAGDQPPGLPEVGTTPPQSGDTPKSPNREVNPNGPTSPLLNRNIPPASSQLTQSVAPSALLSDKNYTDQLKEFGTLLSDASATEEELVALIDPFFRKNLTGFAGVFIQKSGSTPPPIETALQIDLRNLEWTGQPLWPLLIEISEITNVPFSFSTQDLQAAGFDPMAPVTWRLQNALWPALQAKFAAQDLAATANPWGVLLTPSAAQKIGNAQYPLPALVTPEEQAAFETDLVQGLQQLIEPASWKVDAERQVTIVDGQVAVKQIPRVQQKIQRLLAQLSACRWEQQTFDPRATTDTFLPQFRWADQNLKASLSISGPRPLTLERFLLELRRQTQITVLVDWEALSQEGWYRDTLVPQHFTNSSAEQTLTDVVHAMNLTWETWAPDLLELTTYPAANRLRHVEVYPIPDFLKRSIQPEWLVEFINRTVGRYVVRDPENPVLCHYYPPAQALIVVGPTSVQRQINTLLERLRTR